MSSYCPHCDRSVLEPPNHFNKEGECLEHLRDWAEYQADLRKEEAALSEDAFWKKCRAEMEPEKPLTDEQMHQVERQIKYRKEHSAEVFQNQKIEALKPKWGG